jgi:hypothetical protein
MDTGSPTLLRLMTTSATALGLALLLAACTTPSATPYTLDATFTTCGATGPTGPNQTACDSEYVGTDLENSVSVANGIQSFTIERTGTYRVTSEGAQGASAEPNFEGGRGAQAQADLELTAGDVLRIVVGQAGSGVDSESNGGGGGGSFVVAGAAVPLVVAGGGGGMRSSAEQNGCDANTGTFGIVGSGSSSTSSCEPKTDDESLGGDITSTNWYGSAGAGFFGDGANDVGGNGITYGFGGLSWANGMLGGDWNDECSGSVPAEGGFGGGGSGSGCDGGGGGGGYSGGDGGFIAGGGGSFVTASATNVTIALGAGIGVGDGVVTLEYLND